MYEKGDDYKAQYKQFLGKGIFAVNGNEWQKHKNAAMSIFHKTSLKEYVSIFTENANRVFTQLDKYHQSTEYQRNGVDIQDYFMRFTLDSFAEICFGVKLRSIEEDVNHFAIAFDKVQTFSERRGRLGRFWPIVEKIKPDRDFEEKLSYMNKTVNAIIENIKSHDDQTLENSVDALSAIILKVRKGTVSYSDEELRDFVMNFLIAGRFVNHFYFM